MTTTSAPPAIEAGSLVHVAPGDLLLERNIRDSKPSPELIASVKDVGVLQPITAVLNTDGRLIVRCGQRRTLAALEAGRDTVPVYVTGDDDTTDAAEIARIVTQRDENTHRDGLTAGEEISAIAQLAAFGMPASAIAKKARVTKADVDTALAAAGSKLATATAAKYEQLTLDQIAAVADFENDTETAKALIVCAVDDPSRFPHVLQRKRDDRTRAAAKAAAVTELEATGVKVIDPPSYDDRKVSRLDYLVDAKTGKNITPKTHAKCPGHVAWIRYTEPEYGCTAAAKNGHKGRYSTAPAAAADMTDEQREKAKAERRLVIENNKAWDSAQVVRREWLAEFAKRKSAPKGTGAFLAGALSVDRTVLTHDGNQTTREKLCTEWGLKFTQVGYRSIVDIPDSATEARALVIALLQVLASHESAMDRSDWRRNGKTERHGRYLAFLQSAGYGLSDVEKYALSTKTVR